MKNVLTKLPQRMADADASRASFAIPDSNGAWTDCSRRQFADDTDNVACAFETLGLQPQEMIAIFSGNRREVLLADFAAYANRAVPVSIYSTSSAEQVRYILRDSGAVIAIAGDRNQLEILCRVAGECPRLKQIVSCDTDADGVESPVSVMTFQNLILLGASASEACRRAVDVRRNQAVPDDIATLIYTSGTTGEPKGAILPHSCFDAALEIHHEWLGEISQDDSSMCFLPLSHIFEKAWTYFCLDSGIKIYINYNPADVVASLRATQPMYMCSVPRFWEKAYTAVQEKIAGMNFVKRLFVRRALRVGYRRNIDYVRTGRKVPRFLEAQYRFFDRKVFAPLRAAAGLKNGKMYPTAGAPLSSSIVEFMHACGINIRIGYGLSETTATVTCYPDVNWEPGTVGVVIPRVNVKIGEENEILVKAPTVMRGYFNKPVETEAAFTADGWFRTGDAGFFDEHGELVLTERIKDLFKTSNGKYIAPQALESRLGEDRFIEQVAVIGDRRKYVTAIIIPAFEALRDYARRKKIDFTSNADLIRNADIRNMIEARIDKIQKDRAGFEKIKKFTLLPHEFTIENGELTNTLKLRRPVINRRYADQIEAMYA